MNFTRKLYADDTAVAGGYAAVSGDVLQAMAKSGVKTDADSSTTIPDIKTETPPAPAATTPAPPAAIPPTNGAAPQQAPTPQPAAPVPAPAPPVPEPVIPEVPKPLPLDWRQEIKKVDANDILRELGYDDKMVGFFNKWKTDGNISEYLRAVAVDFGKMTPEQLMKYQLEQAYPEFSPEDLEELYQAKVVDGYKLNPDTYSETEVRRGKLLLAADAKAVKDDLIRKQSEYILSAKPPTPQVDTSAQELEAQHDQIRQRYTSYLTGNQATKDLFTNRKMVLGEGENAFNYEIADPQRLITILQDPQEYVKHVFQEDGNPIVDKQLFIAAAAIDHKHLVNELIKYGRSLGAKSIAEQLENAKKPEGELAQPGAMPTNPAEALAKHGVMTSNT